MKRVRKWCDISHFWEGRKRCFLFRVVQRFSTFFSLFFVILILNICYKKVRYKKKRIKTKTPVT